MYHTVSMFLTACDIISFDVDRGPKLSRPTMLFQHNRLSVCIYAYMHSNYMCT